MSFEIVLMLAILGVALVAFVREIFPVEVTALGVLAILLLTGLVTLEQAVSGFANKATIAVAGLFVLGYAISKSGVVESVAERFGRRIGVRKWPALMLVCAGAALLSGFLNNTAVVAIFIPLVMSLCRRLSVSPSKALIPLSYMAVLGGTLTLIGTSTNLLVSAAAENLGAAPFSMFEFTRLGVLFLAVGALYLFVVAPRLLPSRAIVGPLTRKYSLGNYLTEIRVLPGSKLIGKSCVEARINERYDTIALALVRGSEQITVNVGRTRLAAGDVLIVEGAMRDVTRLSNEQGVALLPEVKLRDDEISEGGQALVEGLVTPTSSLIGKTLAQVDFRLSHGAFVLAIRRIGGTLREKVARIPLHAADALLMLVRRDRLDELQTNPDLVVLAEIDLPARRERFWWLVFVVLPGVVLAAALGVMDIAGGVLIGCVLLLAARVMTPQEAYRAIEWPVVFLIAAFLPVGHAMTETGTAAFFAGGVLGLGGLLPEEWAPLVALGLLYLLTSLLTEVLSNNATALVLAPVAFSLASSLDVSSRPFLIAVCFGASAAFMSPIGYQTHLMVYGIGAYRFLDYVRIGAPLNLLFWILATLAIPRLWPF